MPQAIGAQARFSFVPETTWGTTPGSPAMKLLKAAAYGESLGSDIEELISNSINSNRAVEAARGGNVTVAGQVPFELAALGLGTILKHALGANTTTGAGPYTHTMKRGALPAGLSIEKGFTDIAQYFVFTGCKINSLAMQVQPQGIVTGTFDVIGKQETASGTSLGSPTSTTHTPFVHHEAVVQEGGVTSAVVTNFNINITNELDGNSRAIGSRYIASLPEGKGNTNGEVTLFFEDLAKYNKWLNETASTLKITFTNGANSMEFFFPAVKYFGGATPKIATTQGVVVPLSFRAVYDATELTDVKVTLINTEATI